MVIAKHARDFVHKRTVSDVFPPLLKFFQTLQVCNIDQIKYQHHHHISPCVVDGG